MPVPESPRTTIVDPRTGGLAREWIRYFSDLAAYLSGLVTGVTTVFGRSGTVTATAGDYTASKVTNDSSISGTYVSNALDTLGTAASSSAYGQVKRATSVTQWLSTHSSSEAYNSSEVAAKVDNILAAMVLAGLMSSSS